MSLREKIKKNKRILILFSILLVLLAVFVYRAYYLFPLKLEYEGEKIALPIYEAEIPPKKDIAPQRLYGEELRTAIARITTIDDLINWLNTQFVFQEREDGTVRSIQEFFELKQGNELDFALFSAYVLRRNGLGEASVIRYRYSINQGEQRIGTVVAFRGHDLSPKHITFGAEGARAQAYGWSFVEMFEMEERRIGATITDWQMFLLWPLPSEEDLRTKEWQKI